MPSLPKVPVSPSHPRTMALLNYSKSQHFVDFVLAVGIHEPLLGQIRLPLESS